MKTMSVEELAYERDRIFKGICVKNHDITSWKKRVSRRNEEAKHNIFIPSGIWDDDLDNFHDPNGYNINFEKNYYAKIMRNINTWTWKFEITIPINHYNQYIEIKAINFTYKENNYILKLEQNKWCLDLVSKYDLSPVQENDINKKYSTFDDVVDMVKICIDIFQNIN